MNDLLVPSTFAGTLLATMAALVAATSREGSVAAAFGAIALFCASEFCASASWSHAAGANENERPAEAERSSRGSGNASSDAGAASRQKVYDQHDRRDDQQ